MQRTVLTLFILAVVGCDDGATGVQSDDTSDQGGTCKPFSVSVGSGTAHVTMAKRCTAELDPIWVIGYDDVVEETELRIELAAPEFPDQQAQLEQAIACRTDQGLSRADIRFLRGPLTGLLLDATRADSDEDKTALETQAKLMFKDHLLATPCAVTE